MPIKFKQFQLEDLARAAMHDGAIISWEPGLGKTAAAMAWPLVKEARRVLLVVPGGLHSQFKESARQFFGIHVTTLSTVEQIRGFRLDKPHPANAAPRFFITSYQDLGQNGADERPPEVGPDGKIIETRLRQQRLLDVGLCLTEKVLSRFTGTPFEPKRYFDGIGSEQHGIRCVWKPSLSRVLAQLETFDCVVVDEGTRLQANESMVALGVRLLNPKYRLLLTGTPIKNRLESFFWLAWWVCGGSERPTARFPYAGSTEAREDFANQHLEHDRFLTREEEAQSYQYMMGNNKPKRSKIEKRSNRVCNLHRLWKIISPIVLRRRKDECGEELVPKTVRPIYIQPGEAQQMVYAHHLQHPPVAARGTPGKPVARRVQIGMQLNILRQVALCPHAPELAEVVNGELGHKVSWTDFNPKQAACLSLAADVLEQGEQIIIGSPFRAFNTALHMRLMEAGVSAVLLDGSTSQTRRGELAAQFKAGVFSAMVAGVDAMGEGHSFECCSHLVQASGSWAFDTNEQFIHRVWRLNSKKPVTIYRLVMRNTIDERVALSFEEKGGTSQLALDGRLGVDTVDEIDPEMLLAQAVKDFRRDAPTVPETDIEHQWCNVLRGRLQSAEAHYRTRRQATAALTVLPAAAPSAITLALRKARLEREAMASLRQA